MKIRALGFKRDVVVVLLLLSICGPVPAQENERGKRRIAVYMVGEESKETQGMHKIVGAELAKAISRSGEYSAIDRTAQILNQLSREHVYQRSGAVNDKHVKDLGKQFGAHYLCIAEITTVKCGAYYIDVRLVDVVTAENMTMATGHSSDLWDISEMVRISQQLSRDLISGKLAASAPPTSGEEDGPETRAAEKVAVFVMGQELRSSQGMHKIIGSELAKAISSSDKYSAVDRTAQIIAQITKEHKYQRSGAVNDSHIKDLGKQFGVQYLCIAEITAITGGAYYMDVRLVDVVTAENREVVTEHSKTNEWNINEMMRISRRVARELVGDPMIDPDPLPIPPPTPDRGQTSDDSAVDGIHYNPWANSNTGGPPPADSPDEAKQKPKRAKPEKEKRTESARRVKFGSRFALSYLPDEKLHLSDDSTEININGISGTLGLTMSIPLTSDGKITLDPEVNFDAKLMKLEFPKSGPSDRREVVEYVLNAPLLIRFAASSSYYLEFGPQVEYPLSNNDPESVYDEVTFTRFGVVCGFGLAMGSREKTAAYIGARAVINLVKLDENEYFSPAAKFAFGVSLLF